MRPLVPQRLLGTMDGREDGVSYLSDSAASAVGEILTSLFGFPSRSIENQTTFRGLRTNIALFETK
jgi:hypothetical protein